MSSPTPEEFMMLAGEPDEDCEPLQMGSQFDELYVDPLTSVVESLQTIAAAFGAVTGLAEEASDLRLQLAEARRDCADLEVLQLTQAELIYQVLEIVKPSTSKLANTVRDAINGYLTGNPAEAEAPAQAVPVENAAEMGCPPPAAEMGCPPPAADADVEEWRAYARSCGYAGPDVDKANRSQIRTMLGIAHGEPALEVAR